MKYLRVILDDRLSWDWHIKICTEEGDNDDPVTYVSICWTHTITVKKKPDLLTEFTEPCFYVLGRCAI